MVTTETLTSLAMLKVQIDQGSDYLEYLRPFILQVLVDEKPDPVTDEAVRDYLREKFGLEIPAKTVHLVLKRLVKGSILIRTEGKFHITEKLTDPEIASRKAEAMRHIDAVISALIDFSLSTRRKIASREEAVTALCSFLSEFNIPCLRAYLRGTAIPTVEKRSDSDIVLVSDFVVHLRNCNPERFDSFIVMLQGHMLANALQCPDLNNAPKSFRGVTFYLDTPLLVRRLGVEEEAKQTATSGLIDLLYNLGGTVATFSHSREELEHVIRGAASFIEAPDGRGAIVMESRRKGTTSSDLLLIAGQIDEKLADFRIVVCDTPKYTKEYQIDEIVFGQYLADEVSYYNSRAKEYDINSVRSIYVLRARTTPPSLEKCKAVLVTSNAGFSKAAYQYGMQQRESRNVSAVITDFALANLAWLKMPMGASSLPTTEVLAFSYAALRPSNALLTKYLAEVDKLQRLGQLSARDHQLLRSSPLAQDELMRLTLGEEDALSAETVTATLSRVESEIRRDERAKFDAEHNAHLKTIDELKRKKEESAAVLERLFWKCRRSANRWATSVSVTLFLVLAMGVFSGFSQAVNFWAGAGATAVLSVFTLANLTFGAKITTMHRLIAARIEKKLIEREMRAIERHP